MGKSLAYRWLIGVFLALFFGLQSFSIAHAAEHIDEPHQTECIACDVTVMADDHIVALPEITVSKGITSNRAKADHCDYKSSLYIKPQGRAPPPRGPPLPFN